MKCRARSRVEGVPEPDPAQDLVCLIRMTVTGLPEHQASETSTRVMRSGPGPSQDT